MSGLGEHILEKLREMTPSTRVVQGHFGDFNYRIERDDEHGCDKITVHDKGVLVDDVYLDIAYVLEREECGDDCCYGYKMGDVPEVHDANSRGQ